MASERHILLDELRCIYELAKKDETFDGKAVLICDFMNVLARPFWATILNEAHAEFNDEFKDYFEKTKKSLNKIYDVRKCIIKYLNDNELSYLLDEKNSHWLKLPLKKEDVDVVLVYLQLSTAKKLLDLLQKEHPKFVAQFIISGAKQKKQTEKYKFQIHVKDLEMEIDRYNKMSQAFIWRKIQRLVDFTFLYDPKKYNVFKMILQKRKMPFTKKSFEVRRQAVEKGVGSNCVDLSLELDAMFRIIHFLASKVGASAESDKKKPLWSYRLGRFIGNGKIKQFTKTKAPAQILEILTETPASRKKSWRYTDLAKFINDDLLKNEKQISFYKQCERINIGIYEATGILGFIIYDTFSCSINPDYID